MILLALELYIFVGIVVGILKYNSLYLDILHILKDIPQSSMADGKTINVVVNITITILCLLWPLFLLDVFFDEE